jgi:hypothetical protein
MTIVADRTWPATMLAVGSLLMLTACADTPPPNDAMAQAELALAQAEAGEASVHAPAELALARRKLDQARAYVAEEDYEAARLLADEATADARLALARSRAEMAAASTEELQRTLDALRQDVAPAAGTGAPRRVTSP